MKSKHPDFVAGEALLSRPVSSGKPYSILTQIRDTLCVMPMKVTQEHLQIDY